MLPIELPMLTNATDMPTQGSKTGCHATLLADDAAGADLFAFLKESFASALAEVSANQNGAHQQEPGLPPKSNPVGEAPKPLPITLTRLVELIHSNNESDTLQGQLLTLLNSEQDTFVGEDINAFSDLAVPTDSLPTSATDEVMSLIDIAVTKKDDQALMQWLSTMGISDKKIQTRALERWLKLQHMAKAGPPTSGLKPLVVSLPHGDVQAVGLDTTANDPALNSKISAVNGKISLDNDLAPHASQAGNELTKASVKGAAQSEAPASASPVVSQQLKTTKLEAPAQDLNQAPQTTASDESLNSAGQRQETSSDHQRHNGHGLHANSANHSNGPTDQALDLADEIMPGSETDSKPSRKVKTRNFLTSPSLHAERSAAALPEEKIFDGQSLSATKVKGATANAPIVAVNDAAAGETTAERSALPGTDPILENTTLFKADSSGQMRSGGIRAQDVQSFMRQHAPEVMTQIVDKAVVQVRNGQKEMKIQLKPSFLGQMKMRIITENQQVTIRILTESPAVKDVIENHLYQLKADLGNHGLSVDRVDVFVSSDSNQQENRDTANSQKENPLDRDERQAKRERENDRQPSRDPRSDQSGDDRTGGIDYFA